MKVVFGFSKGLYIFDYIKFLVYNFIGDFEKIIILLSIIIFSTSFLNYVELINFYPTYIIIARNISFIFFAGYFGVEIVKISILSFKLNKRLRKINTDQFTLRIDKNTLTLYNDDNDLLKSIDLKNLYIIQYLRPTLYLIDINENVFLIVNKKKIRTYNFFKLVEFFEKNGDF